MEENYNVKLKSQLTDNDCRRIWNSYATGRVCIRKIMYYILALISVLQFFYNNIIAGFVGIFALEILILVNMIATPRKVRRRLATNWIDEVILDAEGIIIGNVKWAYIHINKIIMGDNYVVVGAERFEFMLVFQGEDATKEFMTKLKKCGCLTVKPVIKKKRKILRRIVYGFAVAFFVYLVAYHGITILRYDTIVDEYTKMFKDKYNIELAVLEDRYKGDGIICDEATAKMRVLSTIKSMEDMLERFPEDIFRELNLQYEGMDIGDIRLKIIVTGEIDDIDRQLSLGGVTCPVGEGYDVYIYYDGDDVESTIVHEIFHVLSGVTGNMDYEDLMNMIGEFFSGKASTEIDAGWNKYNPEDFKYYDMRLFGDAMGWQKDYEYTTLERDKEDIYFVSNYSKSSIDEDMAEVFEALVVSDNKLPYYYKSPHIQGKAEYIIQFLDEKFESVDEDVYWNKWFK